MKTSNTNASDVLVFTDDDFDIKIRQHAIVLVKFFAPWCGHCQSLAPEFERAASVLKNNEPKIVLAEFDCSADGKATCNTYQVKGYPTLKVFVKGELSFGYDGPRKTAGDIIKYMNDKFASILRELKTVEEFDDCLYGFDNFVMGFFDEEGSPSDEAFKELFNSQKDHFKFARTYANKLLTKYGYRNDIVIFRAYKLETKLEQSQVQFEGNFTLYELRSWLTSNYHGLVGFRTETNIEQFNAPLVIIYGEIDFSGKPTDTRYYRNRAMTVAKKFTTGKRKVTFVLSDARDFRQEIIDFSLDPAAEKPLVAARDASQRRYALRTEFSMETLEQFVEDMLNGTIEPFIKSDPIPVEDDGPIKTVVTKNFDKIMYDRMKDVVLMLDADWCIICKTIVKKLEKIAKKLKDEKDIVIARIDVTTNEVPRPYFVKGYPSIYFSSRKAKFNPKLFEGKFEIDDLLQFIAAEATTPLQHYDRNGQKLGKKNKMEENATENKTEKNDMVETMTERKMEKTEL